MLIIKQNSYFKFTKPTNPVSTPLLLKYLIEIYTKKPVRKAQAYFLKW